MSLSLGIGVDAKAFVRQLDGLKDDFLSAAVRALTEALRTGKDVAKSTTSYRDKTTNLRSKTDTRQSMFTGELRADTPYAKFVNNGTRPHEIRARNAKALRFVVNGNVIFARKVQHPGTKPRLFMDNAAAAAERDLVDSLADYVDHAAQAFNQAK